MDIVFADAALRFNGDTPFIAPLGGSQSSLVYTARALADLGCDVTVYCGVEGEPGNYAGVDYQPLHRIESDRRDTVDAFIANRDPRLSLHWKGSGKKILRIQDDWDQPLMVAFTAPRLRLVTDHVLSVSDWQRKRFIKAIGWNDNAITTIPNGFWRPNFSEGFPEKVGHRLAYCSTPFRGLKQLLDIFPTILQAVPEAELHVFSDMKIYQYTDEEEEKECGHIYEKIDQPGVVNHGSMGQVALAKELEKCKILAYSNTFTETSCIAAMEAQAAGCVVVTSGLGALTETVGPNGVFIPGYPGEEPYDKRFSEECIKLLRDVPLWMEKATLARAWIQRNSYDELAHQWITVINNLNQGRKSRCLL